jgi:hypothetical protein
VVGAHLVMVGRLIDSDPELAYDHAQAAVRRGGRVDVVREAAGLAAYRTERYSEALRELRTVRRLNGSSEHLPVMADCERGLGRPERAIALAAEPEAETLPGESRIELAMVVSGARLDLEQPEAAVAVLDTPLVRSAKGLLAVRVAQARADALDAAGRADDARAELARFTPEQLAEAAGVVEVEDEIVVFDIAEESEDLEDDADDTDDADHGAEDVHHDVVHSSATDPGEDASVDEADDVLPDEADDDAAVETAAGADGVEPRDATVPAEGDEGEDA